MQTAHESGDFLGIQRAAGIKEGVWSIIYKNVSSMYILSLQRQPRILLSGEDADGGLGI